MMFFDPFQELDRLTNSLLSRQGPIGMPVDLYRQGDHYVLNADLPGVDPGSVDVSVDGRSLTIRAQRTVGTPDDAQWLVRERPTVSFVRQFSVGDGIDADGINARYDNGVLSILIPVSEKAKPRRIEVTAGRPSVEARQSKSAEHEADEVTDAHAHSEGEQAEMATAEAEKQEVRA